MSLSDKNVTLEEKRQFCATLLAQPPPDESTIVDKFTISQNQIRMLGNWELHHFITENTVHFFSRFDISRDFLEKDPSEWSDDDEFKNTRALLSTLEVVNDNAERGVKLMEDFNKLITKDEEMKQFLLLTVSEYRKKFPGYTKTDLKQPEA